MTLTFTILLTLALAVSALMVISIVNDINQLNSISRHIYTQNTFIQQNPSFEDDSKSLAEGVVAIRQNMAINNRKLFPMAIFVVSVILILIFGPFLTMDKSNMVFLGLSIMTGVGIISSLFLSSKKYTYQAEGMKVAADILVESSITYLESLPDVEEYEYVYYDDDDNEIESEDWLDYVDDDDDEEDIDGKQ